MTRAGDLRLREPDVAKPAIDPTGRRTRVGVNVLGRQYREIEVLRALAAVLVVVFHCWQNLRTQQQVYPFQHNHAAVRFFEFLETTVDLFFVVSAFLLALPFLKSMLDGTPRPKVKTFLQRRIMRVVPLCWFVFVAVWVTRNFSLAHSDYKDLGEHLTFTQSFDTKRIFYTDGPAWSMSVEVHFYIALVLWATLLIWVGKMRLNRNVKAAFLMVLLLGQLAACYWYVWWSTHIAHHAYTDYRWYYSLPGRAGAFTAGMILALVVVWRGEGRKTPKVVGLFLRLCAIGMVPVVLWAREHSVTSVLMFHDIAGIMWALWLADGVMCRSGRLARLLQPSWLVSSGALTFSLYMWHEPLVRALDNAGVTGRAFGDYWMNLAIVIPIALLIAVMSLRFIEEPGERITLLLMRKHGGRSDYAPVPAPVVVPSQVVRAEVPRFVSA